MDRVDAQLGRRGIRQRQYPILILGDIATQLDQRTFGGDANLLFLGLTERRVIYVHAFKAALVNVIPVIGVQAGFVLGGAVYIETVFQWPGIGAMLVKAISTRDLLLVQGGVLVVAASYVLFNLLADVAQSMLDPRLKS